MVNGLRGAPVTSEKEKHKQTQQKTAKLPSTFSECVYLSLKTLSPAFVSMPILML